MLKEAAPFFIRRVRISQAMSQTLTIMLDLQGKYFILICISARRSIERRMYTCSQPMPVLIHVYTR